MDRRRFLGRGALAAAAGLFAPGLLKPRVTAQPGQYVHGRVGHMDGLPGEATQLGPAGVAPVRLRPLAPGENWGDPVYVARRAATTNSVRTYVLMDGSVLGGEGGERS